MLKMPVSVLQELVVQKKIPIPVYEVDGTGQPHCMSFTCRVKAGTYSAMGVGDTKKDAKHDAARNMLKLLGVKLDNSPQIPNICLMPIKQSKPEGPTINYIGKLNEFASGHRHPQPTYTESSTTDAHFSTACTFNQFETVGYGYNKKDAKQDSARKMLALIKENDIGNIIIETPSPSKLVINDATSERVLKTYTEMMTDLSINENNNQMEPVSKEEVNINMSTWEDVTELFKNHGYTYELSTFQVNPLILSLKVNSHILMTFGKSRPEILDKFVKQVADMIRIGFDFAQPPIAL